MSNQASIEKLLSDRFRRLATRYTHDQLDQVFELLGVQEQSGGSKTQRVAAAWESLDRNRLTEIADKYLKYLASDASDRIELEDSLWRGTEQIEVSLRRRREIVRSLTGLPMFTERSGFLDLVRALWETDASSLSILLGSSRHGMMAQVEQHCCKNSDWDAEMLFESVGAFRSSSRRFLLFLEGLVNHRVLADEGLQRQFVMSTESPLRECSLQFREEGVDDGYPLFRIVPTSTPHRRPKNLIFASREKPDIRIVDALNNDIEVCNGFEKVLIFDRNVGSAGLRWCDLQDWWSDLQSITDPNLAKSSLYKRLRSCLPTNSPPQRAFFDGYHRLYGTKSTTFPVLAPEVWMHWDPKVARERGLNAMLRFRMDFLMLLANGVRVVIEIDGKHHYSNPDGTADPVRYDRMVEGDRELTLAGYEVYRFGTIQLCSANANQFIAQFFESLFAKHNF